MLKGICNAFVAMVERAFDGVREKSMYEYIEHLIQQKQEKLKQNIITYKQNSKFKAEKNNNKSNYTNS